MFLWMLAGAFAKGFVHAVAQKLVSETSKKSVMAGIGVQKPMSKIVMKATETIDKFIESKGG